MRDPACAVSPAPVDDACSQTDGVTVAALELLRGPTRSSADAEPFRGVVIGVLVAVVDGAWWVSVPALSDRSLMARSTVALAASHVGASVVLVFEGGDGARPIILGVLQSPPAPDDASLAITSDASGRVALHARRELVLRCGDASILLAADGRVIIEGRYVLSRSAGYNKIKGAVVDIN